MSIHTSYLNEVYNLTEFSKIVEKAIPLAMKARREVQFDTIAFSGHSGAALSYILSKELHVPLICIRKPGEDSHYSNLGVFEGSAAVKKYIIVDDFIAGGNTVRRIREAISSKVKIARCVAYLLYAHRETRTSYQETPVYPVNPETSNWEQRNLQFPGWYG